MGLTKKGIERLLSFLLKSINGYNDTFWYDKWSWP